MIDLRRVPLTPSRGERSNLPAVVLPHGGPSSRDTWGFDWLAQFFAARGYAVIHQNERGRYFSEGEFEILGYPRTDGYDALTWIALYWPLHEPRANA